jgi:hypothetical protein
LIEFLTLRAFIPIVLGVAPGFCLPALRRPVPSLVVNGDWPGGDSHHNPRHFMSMQTIDAFDKEFPDETACKNFLVSMRWPDGVRCPRCNRQEKVYALKARPYHWTCCNPDCGGRKGYRFSVITKTIFENTKIDLKLWFKVAYLVLTAKKGISALQVHRMIFGEESTHAYHRSWYMVMRWRAAMKGNAFPLTGVVEVDETYIGGKDRNRHWNKKSAQVRATKGPQPLGDAVGYGKVGVIGGIERKGSVVAKVIGGMGAETLGGFVRDTVSSSLDLFTIQVAEIRRAVADELPKAVAAPWQAPCIKPGLEPYVLQTS